MRLRKGLWTLALVGCLAGVSVASADSLIWFTSPSGSVGPNNQLVLPGPGTYTITARATTDQLDGYSIDLFRYADTGLTAANWTGLIPGWEITDTPTANDGDFLLGGAGQALLFSASATGTLDIFRFDLTIAPGATGNVFAGVGFAAFAPFQQVTFGPNAPLDGADANAVGTVPVIVVPEPASLALLGLGALALLRRRR